MSEVIGNVESDLAQVIYQVDAELVKDRNALLTDRVAVVTGFAGEDDLAVLKVCALRVPYYRIDGAPEYAQSARL